MAFKSDKDKEQFISKLQSAGFSPEEIDKEVGDIESAQVKQPVAPPAPKPSSQFGGGGSPLTTTAPPPVMEQPTAGEAVNKLADLAQQREEQKQDLIGQVWDTTAGKVLGGLGLAYGGYKLGRLAERKFGETTGLPVEQRIEPTMGTPRESARLPQQAQMSAEEQWRASLSPREQEMIARSEAAKASKAAEASARAAVTPAVTPEPPAFLLREPPAGAATPPEMPKKIWEPPTASLAISQPATPTAPPPAPAEAAPTKISPVDVEQKLGKATAVTGTGMPAYHGEGTEKSKLKSNFNSIKEVPKGYVFVPGGNYMDAVRNAVGQEAYTANLKATGGYPTTNEAQSAQSREINRSLGRPTREEAIAKGLPLGEKTEPITIRVAGKKAVQVGGVTGALILATDLASAAQEGISAAKQGDRQMATGYLTDILGALTGPIGYTASQLFGTSPEDLRTLRAAEQAQKVGAGRGIAPPSAYQR